MIPDMIKFTMKTNYLQAMGIIYWRLRYAAVHAVPSYYNYYLAAARDENPRIMLLAQAGENTQQEQALLTAIIRALGWCATPAPPLPDVAGITSIIFLGMHLPDLSTADAAIISTPSLAEMLQNPLLKAKAWQALKLIKS